VCSPERDLQVLANKQLSFNEPPSRRISGFRAVDSKGRISLLDQAILVHRMNRYRSNQSSLSPCDYLMVAPNCSTRRSEVAKGWDLANSAQRSARSDHLA
jgi:hypothetical protein